MSEIINKTSEISPMVAEILECFPEFEKYLTPNGDIKVDGAYLYFVPIMNFVGWVEDPRYKLNPETKFVEVPTDEMNEIGRKVKSYLDAPYDEPDDNFLN